MEVLLIKQVAEGQWLAMGKPARALQLGRTLTFAGGALDAEVTARRKDGRVELGFGAEDLASILNEIGEIPLPPYIRRSPTAQDEERYQTVFARQQGAIAAPTAGLHFTNELMDDLRRSGTGIQPILLHVGPGTFEPVRSDDPGFIASKLNIMRFPLSRQKKSIDDAQLEGVLLQSVLLRCEL